MMCRLLVADSAEGELGGRKPPLAGPDSESDAAEPDPARSDHGEQGPVLCGTKTIYVRENTVFISFIYFVLLFLFCFIIYI